MTINHESGETVYMQLANILRAKIVSGEITARVPSVKTLSQEYGISHVSTERALGILRDEGLIYSAIGKGWFVVAKAG